jgi:phenylalanine-4-hydroxylase
MSADGFSGGPPPGARPDWTIDQGWEAYSQAEHDVWITLYERQAKVLQNRACDEFLRGLDALDLHRTGIPDFNRINEELRRLTGWSVQSPISGRPVHPQAA